LRHWRAVVWAAIIVATLVPSAVRAVDAVNISVDVPAIDLTDALERPKGEGDRVQVSTAADAAAVIRGLVAGVHDARQAADRARMLHEALGGHACVGGAA